MLLTAFDAIDSSTSCSLTLVASLDVIMPRREWIWLGENGMLCANGTWQYVRFKSTRSLKSASPRNSPNIGPPKIQPPNRVGEPSFRTRCYPDMQAIQGKIPTYTCNQHQDSPAGRTGVLDSLLEYLQVRLGTSQNAINVHYPRPVSCPSQFEPRWRTPFPSSWLRCQ